MDSKDKEKRIPARDFYELRAKIPIPPDVNILGRPLIPFYRHRVYSLVNYENYSDLIINFLNYL